MSKISDKDKTKLLTEENQDLKNKYLRALADYQNLQKRAAGQAEDNRKKTAKDLMVKLLHVVDSLEKAETHLKDQGLTLACRQLRELLKEEKVEKMEVLGRKFDPLFMECIEMDTEAGGDDVIGEIRPGYILDGEVIRVARVSVGKKGMKEVKKNRERRNRKSNINIIQKINIRRMLCQKSSE